MTERRYTRRTVVGTTGILSFAGLLTGASAVSSAHSEGDDHDGEVGGGRVVIEDQDSDGDSIVLAKVEVPTSDGYITVIEKADRDEKLFEKQSIDEGEHEDYTIDLTENSIEESQTIQVWLYDGDPFGDDNDVLAIEEAFISIGDEAEVGVYGTTFVEAEPDAGFHYPYYLFTPPPQSDETVPIIVEPNNTGEVSDDLEIHRERAEMILEGGISKQLSEQLNIPLLIPVFPRPAREPVDGMHYIHALDRETLQIPEGPLERVDLQLLRMTEHARGVVLGDTDYSFSDQLMLNGFSASGNFVDRFAVLHPDRVLSVSAGGLNGMALLPLEEADGQTLPFHVGIADVEELIGKSVDIEALDKMNQFLYMGAEDENDTIPYDDAWTDDDLRQTALDVYGEDMIEDRFPRCEKAYEEAGVEARFEIYEDAGHSPHHAREDILEFHGQSLAEVELDEIGADIDSEWTPEGEDQDREDQTDSAKEDVESADGDQGVSANDQQTPSNPVDGSVRIDTRSFFYGAGVGTLVGAATASMAAAFWVINRGFPPKENK